MSFCPYIRFQPECTGKKSQLWEAMLHVDLEEEQDLHKELRLWFQGLDLEIFRRFFLPGKQPPKRNYGSEGRIFLGVEGYISSLKITAQKKLKLDDRKMTCFLLGHGLFKRCLLLVSGSVLGFNPVRICLLICQKSTFPQWEYISWIDIFHF